MTNHQRTKQNSDILDQAGTAVERISAELGRLGVLQEDLCERRETVSALTAENTRLRNNEPETEKGERVARLRENLSALDIESHDLRKLESDIEAAKATIVSAGHAARSVIAEILFQLVDAKRKSARADLESRLDFSKLGALGLNLELADRALLALSDLQYFFDHSLRTTDADQLFSVLSQLARRFADLRTFCEAEENLTLRPTAAVAIVEPRAPMTREKAA